MKYLSPAIGLALLFSTTTAAQQVPHPTVRLSEKVQVQLPARPETARRPGTVVASDRVRLERSNADFLRLRQVATLPSPNEKPGIASVNGQESVLFEPGGRYLIRGAGFGDRQGDVQISWNADHRYVPLRILSWKPNRIEIEVPGDVSGKPDRDGLALGIRPVKNNPLLKRWFGFRAARVEIPVGLNMSVGEHRVAKPYPDFDARMRKPPEWLRFERKGADERCFDPGQDRINTAAGKLANGFIVTRYEVWFAKLEGKVVGGAPETRFTPFGRYSARWEGDTIVIDWGVQRERRAPFAGIGGSAKCTSSYRIQFYVTGPRGVDPFRPI